MKQSYLVGRRVDALLRNYFKYMDTVYGKDIAIATAIEKDNIKDSLSQYSGSFANYKDSDLYVSMFKVVMTSKEVNDSLEYARRKIESGEIDDIIMDMESSLYFRKDIVENVLLNAHKSPRELYSSSRKDKSDINSYTNRNIEQGFACLIDFSKQKKEEAKAQKFTKMKMIAG